MFYFVWFFIVFVLLLMIFVGCIDFMLFQLLSLVPATAKRTTIEFKFGIMKYGAVHGEFVNKQ